MNDGLINAVDWDRAYIQGLEKALQIVKFYENDWNGIYFAIEEIEEKINETKEEL